MFCLKNKKKFPNYLLGVLFLLTFMPYTAYAQVPMTTNFQGYLTDSSGGPMNGQVSITFSLYDVSVEGTPLWTETHSSVTVSGGVFNVILGKSVPFSPDDFDGQLYLGVTVGSDSEMAPREKLTGVPYAFRADVANRVHHADSVNSSGFSSTAIVFAQNSSTEPDSVGVHGEQTSSGNYGYLGHEEVGAGGVHSSGNQAYLGTEGNGVSAECVTPGCSALAGLTNHATGNGAIGQHFESQNYGILGNKDFGVYGKVTSGAATQAVYGLHEDSGNWGFLGNIDHGAVGTHNSGNEGRLGSSSFGVEGYHAGGNYGRLGTANYGIYGWSSGTAESVRGEHVNPVPIGSLPGSVGHPVGKLAGPDFGAEGVYLSNSGQLGTPNYGVYGKADGSSVGVQGDNPGGFFGALGGPNYGVHGHAPVTGDVIAGWMQKGGGTFKIDHPLDPENKYLYHSFVESPDMMNIYNGNVILDDYGEAVVELPDWFEALNRDFRYQLTCIGGFAQVFIAEEISDNRFKIGGGDPGMKVSWQVTGIRQDPYANAHRVTVEEDKPENERGHLLYPEAYGQSD
jgi:hypothetical protein